MRSGIRADALNWFAPSAPLDAERGRSALMRDTSTMSLLHPTNFFRRSLLVSVAFLALAMIAIGHVWRRATADWDHRITAALGGAATLNVSLDLIRNWLGLVVLLVGLVCSIRKELRESRQDKAHRGDRPA